MFSQFLIIAFTCYFSFAHSELIAGLEGKWRLSRAEKNGYLISRPMWKGYTLEIAAVAEEYIKKPVARSYRKAKSAVFLKRKYIPEPMQSVYKNSGISLYDNNGPLPPSQPEPTVAPVAPNPAQPVQPAQPTQPVTPVQPVQPVKPSAPTQQTRSGYYTFTFYVKNKITATLRLREDGKWVIIEGEHTLSIPYGEDYRAEIFIEKVLEAFKYLYIKGQKSLFMFGYGNRMMKFTKIQ